MVVETVGICEGCRSPLEILQPVSDGTESGETDWLCVGCRGVEQASHYIEEGD